MSNFEAMNARQIAETIMRTQDPDQIAPLFMELNSLNPGVSTEVVSLLERAAISDISRGASMVSVTRMMTELTGQELDLSRMNETALRHMQASTQVYMNVALFRGEAAHPLVKAYAQAVSRLSADEYYSPSLLLAAERAVQTFMSQPLAFPKEILPPKYSEQRKPSKKGPRHFEL